MAETAETPIAGVAVAPSRVDKPQLEEASPSRRRRDAVSTPYSDPAEMPANARTELDQLFRAGGVGDLLGCG